MRISALLLLIAITTQSVGQDLTLSQTIKLYEIGKSQFEQHEYETALSSFDSLILHVEKKGWQDIMPDIYYFRASCKVELDQTDDLCEDVKKALSYNISDVLDIAELFCPNLINPEDAIRYFINQGSDNYWDKNYEMASEFYSKVLKIDPENSLALMGRAMSYRMTNNIEGAILDYTKLIDLESEDENNYFFRAELYFEQSKFKESLKDLNKSLEIESSHTFALALRGKTYNSINEYQKAITDFSEVLKTWKTNENYLERAKAYFGNGDQSKACKDLGKISDEFENDEFVRLIEKCG